MLNGRFSAGPQDRIHLESEIRKAHVICIVYSIDNPHSFDRIPTFWLPHFRQLGVNVPVILVGNKIDLRGGEVTNEALEEEIVPIMNEFKVRVCSPFLAFLNWISSTFQIRK
jgi:GTPase SAR1 family protein